MESIEQFINQTNNNQTGMANNHKIYANNQYNNFQ